MADSGGGDELHKRQRELMSAFRKGAELAEELIRDNQRLLAELQSLGRRYEERILQIERENHNLAAMYVAAYQLHASLQPGDVLRTTAEILSNFVGARTFAIYLHDGHRMRPIIAEGVAPDSLPDVEGGELFAPRGPGGAAPLTTRMLRLDDKLVGGLAVWELLAQKPSLEDVDVELLNLLGAQGAIALEAARLHAAAGGGS